MDSRSLFKTPTMLIITLNIAAYIIFSFIGGDFINIDESILFLVGQSNTLVMRGWYWQVITSLFVHANILHLMGNMLFLLIFGLRAEDFFSSKLYIFIFFASGVVGNMLTLLMGPHIVSVGASGAIFGVFGATVIYAGSGFGKSLINALIYSFYIFIINIGVEVNLLAHFGGLVSGLVIGYNLYRLRYEAR